MNIQRNKFGGSGGWGRADSSNCWDLRHCMSSHDLQLVGLIELMGFTKSVCSHGLQLFGWVELLEFTGSGCSHGACAPMVHVLVHNLIGISGIGGSGSEAPWGSSGRLLDFPHSWACKHIDNSTKWRLPPPCCVNFSTKWWKSFQHQAQTPHIPRAKQVHTHN